MNSRLVALAILDAIQVSLAIALGEPAETNLRASKSTLNQHIQTNASVALERPTGVTQRSVTKAPEPSIGAR